MSSPSATLTITTFPSEILVDIYLYLVSFSYWSVVRGYANGDYRWIPAATHICRHWRTVALEAPTLWCMVNLDWPSDLVVFMLRKSEALPLHFYAHFMDRRIAAGVLQIVARDLYRAETIELQFEGIDQSLAAPAYDADTFDIPRLRQLRLQRHVLKPSSLLFISPQCPLTSLACLELIVYPWNVCTAFLRPTLTTLTLTGAMTSIALLRALELMPLLESLKVSFLPGSPQDAIEDPHIVVTLPSLDALKLMGDVEYCGDMLRHLHFPTITTLTVLPVAPERMLTTQLSIERLYAAMSAKLLGHDAQGRHARRLSRLSVIVPSSCADVGQTFLVFDSKIILEENDHHGIAIKSMREPQAASIAIKLGGSLHRAFNFNPLKGMLSAMSSDLVAEITSMILYGGGGVVFPNSTFLPFSGLNSLTIPVDAANHYRELEILGTAYFPRLRLVYIVHNARRPRVPSRSSDSIRRGFVDFLYGRLIDRKTAGIGVERLVVDTTGYFTKEEVKILSTCVAEMVYNHSPILPRSFWES